MSKYISTIRRRCIFQPSVDEIQYRRQKPRRDEKILSGHRRDVNVTVDGIDNLARWGSSDISERYKQNNMN